jgi:hypothetical protein
MTGMRLAAEFQSPSPEQFRSTILHAGEPAVLRSVANHWPLVAASKGGADWMAMLASRATDLSVGVIRAEPEEEGRFHYSADGRSLNFIRGKADLPTFLGVLGKMASERRPHALAAQGLPAEQYVPGFAASHPMPLVPEDVPPRAWIGNASKVATHNDPVDNVAVVAAGRRRFTLFPPSAQPDLYMGPDHPTPAGTPVSMVHVTKPDFDLYPRFRAALDVAQEAELGPGDAIFIPKDWYHHVEALEPLNMLVNYWFDAGRA